MTSVLEGQKFQCRVSSVLNKEVSQYGKGFMFDNNVETCWCSDQSCPQWIAVQFPEAKQISSFQIQFQGGFVGKECEVIIVDEKEKKSAEPFYPEDINSEQYFKMKETKMCKQMTLKFNSSTDFFGRIIVYKLDFLIDQDS